jgi:hypothetical protein
MDETIMPPRKHPQKSTPSRAPSPRDVTADNARRREQRKRLGPANPLQQGNRANVRQNTTRQGNRRGA